MDLLQDRTKPVTKTHDQLQGEGGHHGHVCPHQAGGHGGHDRGDGTIPGRVRQSTWPLISVEQAQAKVFSECHKLLRKVSGNTR